MVLVEAADVAWSGSLAVVPCCSADGNNTNMDSVNNNNFPFRIRVLLMSTIKVKP